jgi:hypothetical protein
LNAIYEVALVTATIFPPKHSSAISLTESKLTFIYVSVFACPFIKASALFLIGFEITHIVIAAAEIQFTLPVYMAAMKAAINNLLTVFVVSDTESVRPVTIHFSNINHVGILDVSRLFKLRVHMENAG